MYVGLVFFLKNPLWNQTTRKEDIKTLGMGKFCDPIAISPLLKLYSALCNMKVLS
jgi:hypothetical protein